MNEMEDRSTKGKETINKIHTFDFQCVKSRTDQWAEIKNHEKTLVFEIIDRAAQSLLIENNCGSTACKTLNRRIRDFMGS